MTASKHGVAIIFEPPGDRSATDQIFAAEVNIGILGEDFWRYLFEPFRIE
jgi:hypothetical protein